jgi:hypothetical protein
MSIEIIRRAPPGPSSYVALLIFGEDFDRRANDRRHHKKICANEETREGGSA